MKYKMIVSDFDGTLYTDKYDISEIDAQAIRDYSAAGGRFVIATGRLFKGILPHARQLGLKGEIIAYQGGGIYDIESGEELHSDKINNKLAVDVLDYMYNVITDKKCLPMFYHDEDVFLRKRTVYGTIFCKIVGVKPLYTKQNLNEYAKANNVNPYKLLCLTNRGDTEQIAQDLRGKFGEFVNVTISTPTLIEMVNAASSKETAIKWLCDKYDIKQDEIIALGDSENDIPMIRYAGLGVAMANAMDSVKAVSDYVTLSNNHNGVAAVINEFCLNEDRK